MPACLHLSPCGHERPFGVGDDDLRRLTRHRLHLEGDRAGDPGREVADIDEHPQELGELRDVVDPAGSPKSRVAVAVQGVVRVEDAIAHVDVGYVILGQGQALTRALPLERQVRKVEDQAEVGVLGAESCRDPYGIFGAADERFLVDLAVKDLESDGDVVGTCRFTELCQGVDQALDGRFTFLAPGSRPLSTAILVAPTPWPSADSS